MTNEPKKRTLDLKPDQIKVSSHTCKICGQRKKERPTFHPGLIYYYKIWFQTKLIWDSCWLIKDCNIDTLLYIVDDDDDAAL